MLHIPAVLDRPAIDRVLRLLEDAEWADGRATAGHLSGQVKSNHHAVPTHPAIVEAAKIITDALGASALFISAALPLRIVPPQFNRYAQDQAYGRHIDGSLHPLIGGDTVRTDLSATLFLTPPEDYEGGALTVYESGGQRSIRLPAGDLILYSATSIHEVPPVTEGIRRAAILWVQSVIPDSFKRQMVFELDQTIQHMTQENMPREHVLRLTGHYHNLIRLWAHV